MGSFFSDQGSNPCSLQWNCGVLITGFLVGIFALPDSVALDLSNQHCPWGLGRGRVQTAQTERKIREVTGSFKRICQCPRVTATNYHQLDG